MGDGLDRGAFGPEFPCLETDAFLAFIADNSPNGIHRAGYNGIASPAPRCTGNNVFVPSYGGLNYETLSGLPLFQDATGCRFEPRVQPMHIDAADADLTQTVMPQKGSGAATAP